MKVVLITGAAPYLGGPETWRPLREAAPELAFVEIDPLEAAGEADMERSVGAAVEAALRDADGIVAHGGVARLVLDTVARTRPELPVMLLSPMNVPRGRTIVRVVRAVLGSPLVAAIFTSYARRKLRQLRGDRAYVRRQLGFFVRRDLITDELVDEAVVRLRDPRSAQVVDRTREFLLSTFTPLNPETERAVRNRRVLAGGIEFVERRNAARLGATMLPDANGSPMIEVPGTVAAELRALLSRVAPAETIW